MKFDETYPHIADWIKNRNSISMQEINVGLYAVSASEESTVAVLLLFTDVESVPKACVMATTVALVIGDGGMGGVARFAAERRRIAGAARLLPLRRQLSKRL